MLCQICGKNPASVHFTEIHDNKMSEIHVCERCAEEKGMHASAQQHKFEIADLLAGMVDAMTHTDEERVGHVQCPRCGLLYSSFKETGRLGCSECYAAFQFQLRPLLRRIHGDTRHRGKSPARGAGVMTSTRLARNLRDVPFTHRAHDEQLHGVLASVANAVQPSTLLADGLLLKMQD